MANDEGNTKRKASLGLRLILFGATLIFALGVFEGVCRLLDVDFNPNPNWRYHPVLGWTQEKNLNYETVIGGDRVLIEFNSKGFRDVEHTLEKPSGTKRIVVIGDSFSEAIQVNLEETYWHRLQTLLNQRGGQRWEVINLGVGDFGSAQAWLALQHFGLDYSPDLVISQIFPLNDICNNSIQLEGLCKSRNDGHRPYFVEEAGELEAAWSQPLRNSLRRHFVSFGVLEKAVLTIRQQSEDVDELHAKRYRERGFQGDPLLYTYVEEANQPPAVAQGWRITEAILRRIGEECREKGIAWLPVVIPFEIRVGPAWHTFAANFPNMKMMQDYPERRLGRLFESMGAEGVFLKPIFEASPDRFLPTRGGHLNPAAHGLAAQAILDKMVEAGILK